MAEGDDQPLIERIVEDIAGAVVARRLRRSSRIAMTWQAARNPAFASFKFLSIIVKNV